MTTAQPKYYYHITSFEGWLAIKEKGLRCSSDGYIFLFDTDDRQVLGYAATMQIGLPNFGLFRVDSKGITAKMELDEVAEFTAKHQFKVKQPVIEPKYLKELGMYNAIRPPIDQI